MCQISTIALPPLAVGVSTDSSSDGRNQIQQNIETNKRFKQSKKIIIAEAFDFIALEF